MDGLQIVLLILMFLIPVFFAIISPTRGRFPLKPADFQHVVSRETGVKIFWMKSWGEYWYFSSVGGNQIYTRVADRLKFSDSCELIPFKVSILGV